MVPFNSYLNFNYLRYLCNLNSLHDERVAKTSEDNFQLKLRIRKLQHFIDTVIIFRVKLSIVLLLGCLWLYAVHELIAFIFPMFLAEGLKLRVVTIATSETDGYQRFMRSAKLFDLDVEVSVFWFYKEVFLGKWGRGGWFLQSPMCFVFKLIFLRHNLGLHTRRVAG